jgi:hypothetical protein
MMICSQGLRSSIVNAGKQSSSGQIAMQLDELFYTGDFVLLVQVESSPPICSLVAAQIGPSAELLSSRRTPFVLPLHLSIPRLRTVSLIR